MGRITYSCVALLISLNIAIGFIIHNKKASFLDDVNETEEVLKNIIGQSRGERNNEPVTTKTVIVVYI